jgi:hypothetical protein
MVATAENQESVTVLMVGNNPIDLSRILEHLQEIKNKKIITQFAFDLRSSLQCLINFKPSFILIDDNIGKSELRLSIHSFSHKRKTKDIPITIIKNYNYEPVMSEVPLNYVLKCNLTGELLYRALTNSLKYRKTQDYLKLVYKKRKGQLRNLLSKV